MFCREERALVPGSRVHYHNGLFKAWPVAYGVSTSQADGHVHILSPCSMWGSHEATSNRDPTAGREKRSHKVSQDGAITTSMEWTITPADFNGNENTYHINAA
jgi:hypothetical protein